MIEFSEFVETLEANGLVLDKGIIRKEDGSNSIELLYAIVEKLIEEFGASEDDAHPLDEIALRCMQGLLASGKYDGENISVAGEIAWTVAAVSFLRGKSMFMQNVNLFMALTHYAGPGAMPNEPHPSPEFSASET